MENKFSLLKKEQVSERNQKLFEKIEKSFGRVPNLYNVIAYSEYGLEAYMKLEESSSSLSTREVEAIRLAVSQINGCSYCLSAHSLIARSVGITNNLALEIRAGELFSDRKLDLLIKLAKAIIENRGRLDEALLLRFFKAGYTKENLVDLIVLIGEKTIGNLLYTVTQVPLDFPLAEALV